MIYQRNPSSQFRVWYLFLLQVIAIAGVLQWLGKLEPTSRTDTLSYRNYSFAGAIGAEFNNKRTFVYPCVLQSYVAADGSRATHPLVSIFTVGGLRWNVHGLAPSLRLECLVGLGCGITHPGESTGVGLQRCFDSGSIGTVFFDRYHFDVVDHSAHRHKPLGVGGRDHLSIPGLPDQAFLSFSPSACVPMVRHCHAGGCFPENGDAWRVALRFSLASLLPFLAWSTLRWFVVGYFGLVSFGGYNIIGIAGQLLQKDWTTQLSTEVRPLAEEILRRRESQGSWPVKTTYDNMESYFDKMVWEIAVPAASELNDADSSSHESPNGQSIERDPDGTSVRVRNLVVDGRQAFDSLGNRVNFTQSDRHDFDSVVVSSLC